MAATTGTIASVSTVTLGDVLTAAASIGATTVTVDDTTDFDGENGGTLSLDGVLYGYTAVDDDAGIITLASPLTVAAAVDDRVDVWEVAAGTAAVECRALVSTPDEVDAGDTIDAVVSHALVPLLAEGIRDPGAGETVTLEEQAGEWVVTDVRGKAPQLDGSHIAAGTVLPEALGFQVGSTTVTIAASAPASPNVNDLWIDTTSGNQLNQWNGTVWGPLQFGTDAIAVGAVTADLIAANAIVAGSIAAGALDAVSITALNILGGSIAGNIGSSLMDQSDITDTQFVLAADDTHGALLVYALSGTTTTTLTTPGASTWTVPAGVTSVKVECTGGGGAGGGTATSGFGGQGGGGGEYARENTYVVTPLASINYQIGAGGTGASAAQGGSGGDTIFDGAVIAHGGNGGNRIYQINNAPGGTGSTDSAHFAGGTGHNGGGTFGTAGGGGGSSAGTARAGNAGGAATGTTGGPGASAPSGGAAGGKGGNAGSTGQTGTAGSAPGGGGGGAGLGTSARAGGAGGAGRIKLTYGGAYVLVVSIAAAAGVDDFGNSYPAGVRLYRPDLVGTAGGYVEEWQVGAVSIPDSVSAGTAVATSGNPLTAIKSLSDYSTAMSLTTAVWTCPAPGMYEITFQLGYATFVAGSRAGIYAVKGSNATSAADLWDDGIDQSARGRSHTCGARWYDTGDTVKFLAYQSTGASKTIDNTRASYISIRRCA